MNDPINRRNLVNFAMTQLKAKSPKPTSFDKLFYDLQKSVEEVKQHILPVLQSGGAVKPQDRENCRHLVFTLLLERMAKLSKDELEAVATSIFADAIMQDIDNNPWGKSSLDTLSGE
jgi:hypothetical protein